MENIFRCSICKKEFSGYDAEKDCLNDEIECRNLKPEFHNTVQEAINILTKDYGVEFLEEKHNVMADSDNHGMDYSTYMYFNGEAKYKDNIFKFYISNGQMNEGYALESSSGIVNSFVYKYLREKEIESNEIIGIVERYESNSINEEDGYHYYRSGHTVGNQDINELMYDLEGKKIKIEVLE